MIIDGKKLAQEIIGELKKEREKAKSGSHSGLY